MIRPRFINQSVWFIQAILNSYGMLFFSRNTYFSILIFVVTFFIPQTAVCGLVAVASTIIASRLLGFEKETTWSGLYSYSALLFGLGFATNYETGKAFWVLLIVGAMLTLLLSVSLHGWLNKKGLPSLSLAFIFSTWIIILAAGQLSAIGLAQRHIYWVNEVYEIGGQQLVAFVQFIESWPLKPYISGFFRSMSAIIFQGNIAAGIVLSVGFLFYSRIALVLMIYGYSLALGFDYLMGGFSAAGLTYYNMGTNFMLVAAALGGFYLIASIRSFLWLLITIPAAYLMVIGFGRITYGFGLPVFSLPFCMIVIVFLYSLQKRITPGKLTLTPVQYYSPETNLYRYLNGKERISTRNYFSFQLPFLSEWMVSQGYEGQITHQQDWAQALDFVVLDDEMKTYRLPGNSTEHFYCFNKPVLAPAAGIVEEVVNHIPDNDIGKNNTGQNWGNTIIIRHDTGLYSKLSHLKQFSAMVTNGAYVYKGQIIAACGNSGRSPEPHLHFQIQSTPYIGAKTIYYPIAGFYSRKQHEVKFENFKVPLEGQFVANPLSNSSLQAAFNFQPGYCMKVTAEGFETENWEVRVNMYNESYLHCKKKNAFAYFKKQDNLFYFSNYHGTKHCLLYYFYLSAYQVLLSTDMNITLNDQFPLHFLGIKPLNWVQDIFAPFVIFQQESYESVVQKKDSSLGVESITYKAKQLSRVLWRKYKRSDSTIFISNGEIRSFEMEFTNKKIVALCGTVQ